MLSYRDVQSFPSVRDYSQNTVVMLKHCEGSKNLDLYIYSEEKNWPETCIMIHSFLFLLLFGQHLYLLTTGYRVRG